VHCARLGTLTTDPAGQLDVLGHDRHPKQMRETHSVMARQMRSSKNGEGYLLA
jgi:hypothetical protein